MADLWQWVLLGPSSELQTWFSRTGEDELKIPGKELVRRLGAPVLSQSLLHPLVFGVTADDWSKYQAPAKVSDSMRQLRFALHRDDDSGQPIQSTPGLKTMSLFTELLGALVDGIDVVGLEFHSFHEGQKPGHFVMHYEMPEFETVGQMTRALTLTASYMQMTAFVRGLKLEFEQSLREQI